ncbi:hypothetical protein GEMRC1_012160 [Eukaryota sp. GEM-RC1]
MSVPEIVNISTADEKNVRECLIPHVFNSGPISSINLDLDLFWNSPVSRTFLETIGERISEDLIIAINQTLNDSFVLGASEASYLTIAIPSKQRFIENNEVVEEIEASNDTKIKAGLHIHLSNRLFDKATRIKIYDTLLEVVSKNKYLMDVFEGQDLKKVIDKGPLTSAFNWLFVPGVGSRHMYIPAKIYRISDFRYFESNHNELVYETIYDYDHENSIKVNKAHSDFTLKCGGFIHSLSPFQGIAESSGNISMGDAKELYDEVSLYDPELATQIVVLSRHLEQIRSDRIYKIAVRSALKKFYQEFDPDTKLIVEINNFLFGESKNKDAAALFENIMSFDLTRSKS